MRRLTILASVLLLVVALACKRIPPPPDAKLLREKWEFEHRDWSKMTGVGTVDINQTALAVQASPEQVSKVLQGQLGPSVTNAVGKTVIVGSANVVVFRFTGHPWTMIERVSGFDMDRLLIHWAGALSKTFGTAAVYYEGGDTAGAYGYDRWDSGTKTEHLLIDGDDKPKFWTKLPKRSKPESGNAGIDYIEATFRAWKLYIPEFDGDYFVNYKRISRGSRYKIVNLGIQCAFRYDLVGRSVPSFERVDFFAGK